MTVIDRPEGSHGGNVEAGPWTDADAARNPGTALELDWLREVRVNRSAVERRAATIPTRRTVKKDWQAAWLLKAITCIDLTTLSGDDTPGKVLRLCAKGRMPVRADILEMLGAQGLDIHVGAICVYHAMVPAALEALAGTDIPVAAVSAGFRRASQRLRNGCARSKARSPRAPGRSTS